MIEQKEPMGAILSVTECSRQPKFKVLLNAASGVDSVIDHLNELNNALGVHYEVNNKAEEPKKSGEPSLVRVLDELPGELSYSYSVIHDMIGNIMDKLN